MIRQIFKDCLLEARGYRSPFDAERLYSCDVCGRREDYVLGWVKMISSWDEEIQNIKHTCVDHGSADNTIMWNCITGEWVAVKPELPYLVRLLRDRGYDTLVKLIIGIRLAGQIFRRAYLFVRYPIKSIRVYRWFYQ